ncbi:hypothetical protein Y032_0205g1946 [Ancylostoma ceylanicum]|uniref:Uncharacterized protein n=1 Tax=Ancylostoma ceylanicum TaxID=53326 RepID=A0A016SLQ2_9BILA|nr:hypothetical protein Y032_0205g1946 [Ancylostoma ceylanicum]
MYTYPGLENSSTPGLRVDHTRPGMSMNPTTELLWQASRLLVAIFPGTSGCGQDDSDGVRRIMRAERLVAVVMVSKT